MSNIHYKIVILFFLTLSAPYASLIHCSWNSLTRDLTNKLDDELVIDNLLENLSDCYEKIVKITALYFSGVLIDSEQLYRESIIELSKHLLLSCQILIKYLPYIIKNKQMTLKAKIARFTYIGCFITACIYWMKNIYLVSYTKQNSSNLENKNPSFKSLLTENLPLSNPSLQ